MKPLLFIVSLGLFTISTMFISACEKIKFEEILTPQDGVCSQYNKGSVAKISPFKDRIKNETPTWQDEFADDYKNHLPQGTDASCYTRQPTCLRRLDWNSPDTCLEANYPSLAKLNKCVWNVMDGYNFWDDRSTSAYNPNQVSVSDGNLHLKIKKNTNLSLKCGVNPNGDPNGGNYWDLNCPLLIGGLNSTKFSTWNANTPGFNVGSGRIDFRAKIDRVGPTWPALWMWEQNNREHLTEIDVMEVNPNHGVEGLSPFQTLHSYLHLNMLPMQEGAHTSGSSGVGAIDADIYHTYGVERYSANEWNGIEYAKKAMIRFSIDGCYTRVIENGDPDSRLEGNTLWIDSAPMFFIMGQGVTGDAVTHANELDGVEMAVDWVRVYE